MTNRQGRVVRKQRPKPLISVVRGAMEKCSCPSCGASFAPDELRGSYLARACPHCGKEISAADCDELASGIIEEQDTCDRACARLEASVEWADRVIENERTWCIKPFSWLARRRRARAEARLFVHSAETEVRHAQRKELAKMRYHLSEWFLRTRIPLVRREPAQGPIVPFYDAGGVWHLTRSEKKLGGLIGECQVVNQLFQRASDPRSPLYRAQVLPNIFIPKHEVSENSSFWTQIDCLVLTRQAAFVLEIKRHHTNMVILDDFRTIYVTNRIQAMDSFLERKKPVSDAEMKELGFKKGETYALSQNSYHAVRFADECCEYPYDAIFEQTVFADPNAFASVHDGFIENVNVSYSYASDPHFIAAIEQECSSLPDLMTQQELDDLGERLLAEWGDLNQKRAPIHLMRITRNQCA